MSFLINLQDFTVFFADSIKNNFGINFLVSLLVNLLKLHLKRTVAINFSCRNQWIVITVTMNKSVNILNYNDLWKDYLAKAKQQIYTHHVEGN